MGKSDTNLIFHLKTPPKHFKQGKLSTPIEFRRYESDEKICPVATLDSYLTKTKTFRENQKTTKIFISYKKPHKPVGQDTTARWVKRMLDMSGIDTEKFKAHSKRSASSSKAALRGIPITDVLKMGNWSNESVSQKHYNKNVNIVQKYQIQF